MLSPSTGLLDAPPPLRNLHAEEVHVWYLGTRDVVPAQCERLMGLLAEDERRRMRRYAHARDQQQFVLARILARTVLGLYLNLPGDSLTFETSAYGKPVLHRDHGHPGVHFNLTHSHGVIACAVSLTREVGIDVEDCLRTLEFLELAERFFSPPESAYLRQLPGHALGSAFFSIWTLKEALVKAIGQGLSYPLDTFGFDLDGDRLRRFCPLTAEVPSDWRFLQFQLGERHRGAVAVHAQPTCRVSFHLFSWADAFLGQAHTNLRQLW